MIETRASWHNSFMTKRRFYTGFGSLLLGLALFGLAPSEAKAIGVMCSNDYGSCEVSNNPSWISCSCSDESSTGGTGGDEYNGLSEAELMAVCEAELAYCQPGEETTSEGTTTFGTSDTGEGTGTSDTGEGTSTSDSGEGTGTSETGGGEEGTTGDTADATGGDSGGTTGDSGGTEGDSGTSGAEEGGTTGDSGSGGETGGDGSGGDGNSSGDGNDEATEGDGDGAPADEGDGCSLVNDPGAGALALLGLFGLLGLRSRKR